MEYKLFRRHLAERLGRPVADIDNLVKGLAKVMHGSLVEMNAVAIPTFGTFTPTIHKESISADLSTGRRLLLPPEATVSFTPGAMLLKRLRHE